MTKQEKQTIAKIALNNKDNKIGQALKHIIIAKSEFTKELDFYLIDMNYSYATEHLKEAAIGMLKFVEKNKTEEGTDEIIKVIKKFINDIKSAEKSADMMTDTIEKYV